VACDLQVADLDLIQLLNTAIHPAVRSTAFRLARERHALKTDYQTLRSSRADHPVHIANDPPALRLPVQIDTETTHGRNLAVRPFRM
jgi:hypothetical protein